MGFPGLHDKRLAHIGKPAMRTLLCRRFAYDDC
jgi:hypothetical protein